MKCLLVAGLLMLLGACNAQNFNVTAVLDQILQGYDKRIRPNWGGEPVDVAVSMYFLRIFGINTNQQNIKCDFYFRQQWVDKRLAFYAPDGVKSIDLGPEADKLFWTPDTFFPKGQVKSSHDENMFLKIKPDGSVFKSVKIQLKSTFLTDLRYFPQDQQTFSVELESYGYSASDTKYKWKDDVKSVGMSEEVGSHDVAVLNYRPESELIQLSSGEYSRLRVDIHLARRNGYYIRHFYLPAILSFFLVWASFWFSPVLIIVRIILVLASLLIGNTLLAQSWDILPPVDYPTMLEKYIIFGLFLSALAVVECALAVYVERRTRKTKVHESDSETNLLDGFKKEDKKLVDNETKAWKKAVAYISHHAPNYKRSRGCQILDTLFIIIYPIIFLVFNIWYWMAFP